MATALQGLLPQPGDGTDFPRMAAVNVEVLDGKDVILGAYLPQLDLPPAVPQ